MAPRQLHQQCALPADTKFSCEDSASPADEGGEGGEEAEKNHEGRQERRKEGQGNEGRCEQCFASTNIESSAQHGPTSFTT
eukprot:12400236-Karenia_brevis.AAC.1